MNDAPSVDELIERFLAARRNGASTDVESFAAAAPEHADELRGLLPLLLDLESCGQTARRRPADETPPDIPDHRLTRILGRGGMGTVWEATQISLDRRVAVKIIDFSRHGATRNEQLAREARIVAQLHHPNIVKIHGAGTCDSGRFWYAMELVEGTDLCGCAAPSPCAAVKAVEQAARALAYAHSCGVIHQDVKPSNLLIDATGTVRVTDFGLATVLTANTPAITAGTRDGTLRYMSPERLEHGVTAPAVDQYALGVTLWELVNHRPVFTERDPAALQRIVRRGPVPPLGGTDADLSALVARATAHDPANRYPDIGAFADDLRRWLDHEAVFAAPPSAFRRLRLWIRRNPAAASGAAAALVCACGLVASLSIGYVRTAAALRRADRTAALADAALGDVFRHVEADPPSRRNAELLNALLPYYGKLAEDATLASEKTADANAALGVCAFQSGDYVRAESAFRRLCETKPSARALNLLAETLLRQNRTAEARELVQRVAETYADSRIPAEQYEAARALAVLGHAANGLRFRRQALDLANTLLGEDPGKPEYRFLRAKLMADHPNLEKSASRASVFAELAHLAADYPDRADYALAYVRALERRLRNPRAPAIAEEDINMALQTADRLLGRHPNMPDAVSAVIAFRDAYAAHLRRTGDIRRANRETTRTAGMLELLSNNPESPDAARCRYTGPEGTLPYRQIVVGDADAEPVTLVLYLHHRPLAGTDNERPLTAPDLRARVAQAETGNGRTVFLVPQCPPGREDLWLGPRKNRPDRLLDTVTALVRSAVTAFNVPAGHVSVTGAGAGLAACHALHVRAPALFAQVVDGRPQDKSR